MKAIFAILEEVGFPYQVDGDRITIGLPDGSGMEIATHSGKPMLHLSLPPAAEKCLKHSFDMAPTLVGDYLVDPAAFRRIATSLSDQLEPMAKKLARKHIADFALTLRSMSETEQKAEGVRRIGQDRLRAYLLEQYGACQVSGIKQKDLLVASHIKPWSMCKDGPEERLDIENVLLLAANWDALFDRYYISFDAKSGMMKKSARISIDELRSFGIPGDKQAFVRIPITSERRRVYLTVHNAVMQAYDANSVV